MMSPKVFCIGFHKTGTNSLGEAWQLLGYEVCGVRHDLLPALSENNFDAVEAIVNQFDAFKDNPWPVLYRQLDEKYPGSKFILTIREERSWIKSIVNHFADKPSEMIRYIYGVPYPSGNEEIFISKYRQHHLAVTTYFRNRKNDLLILQLPDENAWHKICEFLGHDIPPVPFPHANKGAYTFFGKIKKYILKRIRSRIRALRNPDTR
ncbi:MAG TPA: sulfotransferase [Flavobacterium sp.]|nr:sulfotransferase [Flavobacterium sp.]